MTLDPIEIPFCWTEADKAMIVTIALVALGLLFMGFGHLYAIIYTHVAAERWRAQPPKKPKDLPPITNGRYR